MLLLLLPGLADLAVMPAWYVAVMTGTGVVLHALPAP
jgi:hypothetical protein